MEKKIGLFIAISLFILNVRIVIQPEYDHYVIGHNLDNTSVVFSSKGVNAIWLGDEMYVPGTKEDYENL